MDGWGDLCCGEETVDGLVIGGELIGAIFGSVDGDASSTCLVG